MKYIKYIAIVAGVALVGFLAGSIGSVIAAPLSDDFRLSGFIEAINGLVELFRVYLAGG